MFSTIEDVIAANQAAGGHWFDPATLRFFRGRIETDLIDGRWFVSSEQNGEDAPRRYTVRAVASDGTVSTVGEYQAHDSLPAAIMWLGAHRARMGLA